MNDYTKALERFRESMEPADEFSMERIWRSAAFGMIVDFRLDKAVRGGVNYAVHIKLCSHPVNKDFADEMSQALLMAFQKTVESRAGKRNLKDEDHGEE